MPTKRFSRLYVVAFGYLFRPVGILETKEEVFAVCDQISHVSVVHVRG